MKIYRGRRTDDGCVVTVEGNNRRGQGYVHVLPLRLDLWNHSPAGFEWGYGGSGPAQLALAILADHLGHDREAVRLHQSFKFQVVVTLPREGWTLTSAQVERGIEESYPLGANRESEMRGSL